MQPWLPETESEIESSVAAPVPAEVRLPGERRADLRNIGLLLAGAVVLFVLLPPAHDYPIIDDWIYSASVQNQVATGNFVMPDQSQASLVGLTLWGTLWARTFGSNYTVLTFSTLELALAGLLAFYGLARALRVPPAGALLGAALLGLNPIFLHLSYSFMTDVPFLGLVLIACFCYVLGLQGRGEYWLWLGGLAAGWAFLIRQFGVLVPFGFLAYLVLEGVLRRQWRWRAMLGVGLVPAAVVFGWWLWSRDMPLSSAMKTAADWRSAFVMKAAWVPVFLLRALYLLPVVAFTAWTAMKLRRSRWWLVGVWLGVLALGAFWSNSVTEQWIGQTEPPFTFRLGPLAIDLPHQIYTFGGDGNIVRTGGIDFYEFNQQPIWSPEAWHMIYLLGFVLGAILLAKTTDALLDWGRGLVRREALTPLPGVYLTGFAIFMTTLALSGAVYDRYVIAFGAFVILFAVRGSREWGRVAWGYSIGALVVVALFSVLLKADAMDHTNARWQAGNWFASRGALAMVGLDWNRGLFINDPRFVVTDVQLPGYRTEARFPYTSRLSGLAARYVLAQSRADLPPLGGGSR